MMTQKEIRSRLFTLQDKDYATFQAKLIPTVEAKSIIGVRTPELRALAKEFYKAGGYEKFLKALPHKYFDENQLHAFLISLEKEFDVAITRLTDFLPYIDNWATCDQLSPKVFKKHLEALLPYIKTWLSSDHTYTVRFAIGMLMQFYLDEAFLPEYLEMVASVVSEEYYIRMEIAWYFATALSKQYESASPYLTEQRLDPWTHKKTIQKAVESNRITPEQKTFLKTLR